MLLSLTHTMSHISTPVHTFKYFLMEEMMIGCLL